MSMKFKSDKPVSLNLPNWNHASEENQKFADNLDHLKHLESEMTAQIALAYHHSPVITANLNRSMIKTSTGKSAQVPNSESPESPKLLLAHLSSIRSKNRRMEVESVKADVTLNFLNLCQTYHLDSIEKEIVLLLFLKNTSQSFRKLTEELETDNQTKANSGMQVDFILNVLSPDFVDQLKNRRYFSIDSNLIKHELIIGDNYYYDDQTSILDENFCLHQRITNFIIGDNNAYSFDLGCISKVNIRVNIEKVVLKDGLKQDIIESAENYLKLSSAKSEFQLKNFFGYGTGLTYLFHGPSGTGKTMMAYALAQKLKKDLLNLNLGESHQPNHSVDDLIKYAFLEAKLSDSILFFDECDDLFEENSHESLVLLTEIEKAECITILATNKVVRLDPAMDRRITMKVQFTIPEEKERFQIFEALIPPQVKLAEDVDFKELAQKYIFTGGLIKNTILTALGKAVVSKEEGQVQLTMDGIIKSANEQANQQFHQVGFGEIYEPSTKIEDFDLFLSGDDCKNLKHLADHTRKRNDENAGKCILITSNDLTTGIKAIEGIVAACDRYVRKFSLTDVIIGPKNQSLKNPLTHEKTESLDFVFSTFPGHRTLTLIVDTDRKLEHHQNSEFGDGKPISDFLEKVKTMDSTMFVVSPLWKKSNLPKEINYMIRLNPPPTKMQIRRWMFHLNEFGVTMDVITDLIEKYPMHISEIDIYVQQAKLVSEIRHGDQSKTQKYLEFVIKTYSKTVPILFG
jgi:hypothetical protein